MRLNDQIIVVGASGFGRESLDVLQAMQENGASIDVVGVVDDAPTADNLEFLARRNVPYLGKIAELLSLNLTGLNFVLGIGNPSVRRRLVEQFEKAGLHPFSAIHPNASIGSSSDFGPGIVVCSGAVISTNVRLGRYVHINPNATVGHDAELHNFVSINPASVISGHVHIEEGVLVGAAATVLQNLTIGARTVIGAAALVTKNVPSDVVVKGVPGVWDE